MNCPRATYAVTVDGLTPGLSSVLGSVAVVVGGTVASPPLRRARHPATSRTSIKPMNGIRLRRRASSSASVAPPEVGRRVAGEQRQLDAALEDDHGLESATRDEHERTLPRRLEHLRAGAAHLGRVAAISAAAAAHDRQCWQLLHEGAVVGTWQRSDVVGLPPQSVKIADSNPAPTGRHQATRPQRSE